MDGQAAPLIIDDGGEPFVLVGPTTTDAKTYYSTTGWTDISAVDAPE
jgi:hypothetical protein